MNLFELFVKIGVKDEASKNISDMTKSLGGGLVKAAKVGTAAIARASREMAGLASDAIKNFADYEQLVGGAELMFGNAFETVMKNADEAYKTVQMSQNEYLQQVNGFATGLKTALGGNEQAAADLAHRIIQAEADVVAATGNTQENVANAFNGIMKSNFTMLDNLQIGITPTKEGFQEVIDKVNEWNKANGKATEYQMGNLADMQSALVDYIDMVGMSGYAQREAANTIQGSLAMTESSWSNLLTGMASDTEDINNLIDNFVESVGMAAENVVPRFEIALEGAVKVVDKLLPLALAEIPKLVTKLAPQLVSSGVNALRSLVTGIVDNKDELIDAAQEVVFTLVDGLVDLAPEVIDGAIELFNGIVDAIPETAVKVVKEMPRITKAIVEGLLKGVGAVFEAAGELLDPTTWRLAEARSELKDAANAVSPFADAIKTAQKNLVDLSGLLSSEGRTIGEIDDEIEKAEAAITEILKKEISERDGLRKSEITSIEEYNANILRLQAEKLEVYRTGFLVEMEKIALSGVDLTEQEAAQALANAEGLLDQANNVAKEAYDQNLAMLIQREKATGEVLAKEKKAAQKAYEDAVAQNQKFYSDTVESILSLSEDVSGVVAEDIKELSGEYKNLFDKFTNENYWFELSEKRAIRKGGIVGFIDSLHNEVFGSGSKLDEIYEKMIEVFGKIDDSSMRSYLFILAQASSTGVEISEKNLEIAEDFLSMFDGVPDEIKEDAKKVLLGIIDGMESQIPGLENASEMSLDAILETLRVGLGVDKGKNLGATFANSIGSGFNTAMQLLGSSVGSVVNSVFGGSYKSTGGSNKWGPVMGSHAGGLAYVPFDGYIAELHKGERVLTAEEAQKYEKGYNVNITVNGAKYDDPNKLATVIAEKIEKMTRRKHSAYA